jgi:hypothetical protein
MMTGSGRNEVGRLGTVKTRTKKMMAAAGVEDTVPNRKTGKGTRKAHGMESPAPNGREVLPPDDIEVIAVVPETATERTAIHGALVGKVRSGRRGHRAPLHLHEL